MSGLSGERVIEFNFDYYHTYLQASNVDGPCSVGLTIPNSIADFMFDGNVGDYVPTTVVDSSAVDFYEVNDTANPGELSSVLVAFNSLSDEQLEMFINKLI